MYLSCAPLLRIMKIRPAETVEQCSNLSRPAGTNTLKGPTGAGADLSERSRFTRHAVSELELIRR